MITEDIIEEALLSSPDAKAKMIEALLSGMGKPDPELDAIWGIEAEIRLDAYKNRKTKPIPFDQVFPGQLTILSG